MALEGSIQTFELAEILQMIQRQKKEGILALAKGREGVRIQFKEGQIIKASEAEEEDALLNLLLKAELIQLRDVKVILNEQKRIKKPLAETLVSLDIIAVHQLKRIIRLYTEEMVFQLFSWKSGKYKFEEKKVSFSADLIDPMSIEFILMEGVRRIDEWPLLLKKIPSRQITFEVAPAVAGKTAQESDPQVNDEASFASLEDRPGLDKGVGGGEEAWFFEQINHDRNVQEMIDLAEIGTFSVYKGLVDLLSEGKIKKKTGREVKVASESLSIKDIERREKIMKVLSGGLVIASTLFLIALSYPSIRRTLLSADLSIQEIRKLTAWNEIDLIRHHLEVYYLKKDHYPTSLQELFSEEGIRIDGVDPDKWRYRLIDHQGEKYQLELK